MSNLYVYSILPLLGVAALLQQAIDINDLIRRSVAATEADWKVAPHYRYRERDVKGEKIETYDVTMIYGSPYYRLLARNNNPLPPEQELKEKAKFQTEVNKRRHENPSDRTKRIAAYQREREQDHLFLREMANAFTYRLLGEDRIEGRSVFVVEATPRPEYRPPDTRAKTLTRMRGKLWIDKAEYQWVKVEAEVTAAVSLYFVARVGPGTRFSLEQMPIGNNLWLPKRFTMQTKVTVFGVPYQRREEETYSDYQLVDPNTANAQGSKRRTRSKRLLRAPRIYSIRLNEASDSSRFGP